MRALVLHETTGPSGLRLDEVAEPETGENVLIEVHAAGVSFADELVTRGAYQIAPPLPFVPGAEVAGVVRSAPAGSGLSSGDRVAATTPFGAFAEVAAAPPFLVFPIPDSLGFDVAAGLVVNHQTAHLGLKRRGRLAPGEAVLVHGAGGGTGLAAIGVARALAAGQVIAVASTPEKRDAAAAAGADAVLDSAEDWAARVRELTAGRGADVVWDPVGGETFATSLRCMAPEGRLLVVGFASGEIPQVKVNRLLLRHLDVVGVNYGGLLPFDQDFPGEAAAELMEWVRSGLLRPTVSRRYPLADGAQALEDLAARRTVGKAVLVMR
jgi:NADPH2:quinone reductase